MKRKLIHERCISLSAILFSPTHIDKGKSVFWVCLLEKKLGWEKKQQWFDVFEEASNVIKEQQRKP
jgi:hypothetical protein